MLNLLNELSLLLEDRADYIAKSMGKKLVDRATEDDSFPEKDSGDAHKIVDHLKKADPTSRGENLQYLARMYVDKQFKFEDISRVKDDLTLFIKVKNKLENKDLNSYKTLGELYTALKPFEEAEDLESNKEKAKQLKSGAKKLIDTPNFKVIVPETEEAACYYGAGTRWCTAAKNNNMFKHYNDSGQLFIIIAKKPGQKERKFQFHYESDQMMDEQDQALITGSGSHATNSDVKFLSSFPEYTEFLNMLIDKHYAKYFDK